MKMVVKTLQEQVKPQISTQQLNAAFNRASLSNITYRKGINSREDFIFGQFNCSRLTLIFGVN